MFRHLPAQLKFAARSTGFILVVTIGQGIQARYEYSTSIKLPAPSGPTFGIERIVQKMNSFKFALKQATDELIESTDHKIKRKYDEFIDEIRQKTLLAKETLANHEIYQSSSRTLESIRSKKPMGNMKLLLLGDSLACGVGCEDESDSPVFPKILANVISQVFDREVEW